MTMRTTVHRLVEAWRMVKHNPDIRIKTGDWTNPTWNTDQFRKWFKQCLFNKINASDSRFPCGRKSGEEYQTELKRLRQYVGNRIIIDWIAPCLGARVRQVLSRRLRCNIE